MTAAQQMRRGRLTSGSAWSAALDEEIRYRLYLPFDYLLESDRRYPVLYLLHGRGDSLDAWPRVVPRLDALIEDGVVPPIVLVMPDAQWSEGASWYVDSAYTGTPPGRPVETAMTSDLVKHVDATYRTVANRDARFVGGYSMGGAGTLRYLLRRPDLFSGGLVLSPAVYVPLPPADSNARAYGAFGRGDELFDDDVYARLSYPRLLSTFDATLSVRLFLAVGDREQDLDVETLRVHEQASRVAGIDTRLEVRPGDHDWSLWEPAFADGLPYILSSESEEDAS